MELKLGELLPNSQVIWHVLILIQPQKTASKGHCCEPHQHPFPCASSSTCSALHLDCRQQRRLLVLVGCPPREDQMLL